MPLAQNSSSIARWDPWYKDPILPWLIVNDLLLIASLRNLFPNALNDLYRWATNSITFPICLVTLGIFGYQDSAIVPAVVLLVSPIAVVWKGLFPDNRQ
ncbi:hypothetical protein FLONG3_4420 [Fusarium longipes]|uniref:Uncharacterized protein n=1 Tax=Fusarium longipes TaxID=694270 RepID=A0A395SYE1_9HYPO|nr:hypothetical protein FLONG3_4420 [Fusarium longipes]